MRLLTALYFDYVRAWFRLFKIFGELNTNPNNMARIFDITSIILQMKRDDANYNKEMVRVLMDFEDEILIILKKNEILKNDYSFQFAIFHSVCYRTLLISPYVSNSEEIKTRLNCMHESLNVFIENNENLEEIMTQLNNNVCEVKSILLNIFSEIPDIR